jgi:cytoskeletal protein RodZ
MNETESLGKYFKRERELRNISLKEVAENTKVKEHFLRALEEDRYDLLPSTIYVKSFIIHYAKYIGVNPDDALLRYQNIIKREFADVPEAIPKKKSVWNMKYGWIIGGTIVIALIASYLLFLRPSKPPIEPLPVKPEVKKELPFIPSPQIAGTPTRQEEKPLSLQIKAVEKTWIRIQVDDQPDREILFQPGEGISFRAVKRIYLIVGNAGGLDLIFNDRSLERFGESGEVVTLTFTPQGVETKQHEKPKPLME